MSTDRITLAIVLILFGAALLLGLLYRFVQFHELRSNMPFVATATLVGVAAVLFGVRLLKLKSPDADGAHTLKLSENLSDHRSPLLILLVLGVAYARTDLESAAAAFAIIKTNYAAGGFYRFITYSLLHVSMSHLLTNVIYLYWSWIVLSPSRKLSENWLIFVGGCIAGGVLSLAAKLNPGPTVGCSAGVFALLFELTTRIAFQASGWKSIVHIGIIVSYVILSTILVGGVDHAAHIGGALFGACYCLISLHTQPRPSSSRCVNTLIMACMLLWTAGAAVVLVGWKVGAQ